MKKTWLIALPLNVVQQLVHDAALAGGGGFILMVERPFPLAAALERTGIAEQQERMPSSRQGQGQEGRIFAEGDSTMRMTACQAHHDNRSFAVTERGWHAHFHVKGRGGQRG